MAWLSVWCEVQICIWPSWCHCHSLSLAPVKSRLVVPYWLTWVVPEKGPLNGRVCLEMDEQPHVLKQSSFLHRVAGHKLRILRRFSGHGKLGKFCATSGENCNRVVLVRHSNICVKQLLTGSECSGDLLYCWSWCGMTPDEGHSLLHLLLVVITYGKVSLWRWKNLENSYFVAITNTVSINHCKVITSCYSYSCDSPHRQHHSDRPVFSPMWVSAGSAVLQGSRLWPTDRYTDHRTSRHAYK